MREEKEISRTISMYDKTRNNLVRLAGLEFSRRKRSELLSQRMNKAEQQMYSMMQEKQASHTLKHSTITREKDKLKEMRIKQEERT